MDSRAEKLEAIEFSLKKHLSDKFISIFLVAIITLGLAILIFPIELWVIYQYYSARKKVKLIRERIAADPALIDRVQAEKFLTFIRVHFDDISLDVPQGYIWVSEHSKKGLLEILNAR